MHDLEAQRGDLAEEADRLRARLAAISVERLDIITGNADKAWNLCVKARANEISKGVELGRKIRQEIRQYRRVIDRCTEAESTVKRIKAKITNEVAGASGSDVFGSLRHASPEPHPPVRSMGQDPSPDLIGWRIIRSALASCESAVQT